MDKRKFNKGTQGNKGNTKGYGQLKLIRENVEKHSKIWWTEIVKMMKSEQLERKKIALQEFNKIQVKMIPQDLTSGDEPLNYGVIILPKKDTLEADKQTE